MVPTYTLHIYPLVQRERERNLAIILAAAFIIQKIHQKLKQRRTKKSHQGLNNVAQIVIRKLRVYCYEDWG